MLRSTVLRPLAGDFATDVPGRTLGRFQRQGKFLLNELSGGRWLVINPMLTGAVQHCQPKARVWKKTSFVLGLDDETELRYLDDRQMGMVYYVDAEQLEGISRLENQGIDVLADMSFEEFKPGLKKFRGEIKGVLTRGNLISGIGNAYSDEILFAAGISPFRKVGSLQEDELTRLHQQSRLVVEDAISVLRGADGRQHSPEDSRLSQGTWQGRGALPPLRRQHLTTERQSTNDQLLSPLPTRDAD